MPCAFIDDEYTEQGRIPAADGLHPEVRFEYRPATAGHFMRHLSEIDGKNLDEMRKKQAKFLAGQVVSWDITHRNGSAITPIEANCLRLAPEVFRKMFDIVSGQSKNGIDLETEAKNSETGCDSK